MKVERLAEVATGRQVLGRLRVETKGQGFTELTDAVAAWLGGSGLRYGLLTAFCRHTSASLTIQENADPDVQRDLVAALDRLAPRDAGYRHRSEGLDDMPAHVRTMLTDCALAIPILEGALGLGTWQGLYLVEHRDRPHRREILLHALGA